MHSLALDAMEQSKMPAMQVSSQKRQGMQPDWLAVKVVANKSSAFDFAIAHQVMSNRLHSLAHICLPLATPCELMLPVASPSNSSALMASLALDFVSTF